MVHDTTSTRTGIPFEEEALEGETPNIEAPKEEYKRQIVWRNVIAFTYLHLSAVYGVYLASTSAKWATVFFAGYLYIMTGGAITAGAHRLWSHRSYKASWPLQLSLMIFNCMALQDSVIDWSRDHRLHHKYSETNADPYNAKRGFFFAHMGWLMCRKHQDVKTKGKGIDVSDLQNNPFLAFQKKYYTPLALFFCFILPTVVPVYCWNETWKNAYYVPTILRYVYTLHATWFVNSAAHLYGNKPYDRFINPTESMIATLTTFGEGWHNYHHVFPWDYRAGESGNFKINVTTMHINAWAWFGLAYDLKHPTEAQVRQRVQRTGDGSHHLWGCDDNDQAQEEKCDNVRNTFKGD